MTVVRDQLFPQKPPGSRFRISRTGVQPSPGWSTIELPSAFAESGAYPPDRELPQALRDSAPCLTRAATLPKAIKLELGRGAHLKTPPSANHTAAASQPTGRIAKAASWLHLCNPAPSRYLLVILYMYVCMYVCIYVLISRFIKLHITTQSGPVVLFIIICHSF